MDSDFDERYPAIFQPGGEGLPRAFERPAESAPPELSPAEYGIVEPPAQQQPPQRGPAGAVRAAEPAVVSDGGDESQDVTGPLAVASRQVTWTARTWIFGLGAGVAAIVFGVLCLLPRDAPTLDMATSNFLLVALFFPLTDKELALGPFFAIAGMGMLVAMFLNGAPRHPRASPWLRSAAVMVAATALVAAGLSLFSVSMHPDILLQIYGGTDGGSTPYPWIQLTYLTTMPMALFGLSAMAAVAIMRPNDRGRNSLSTARAVGTGIVLLAAAAVTFYAPQIFTGSMASRLFTSGSSSVQLTPWPATLIQVGPYLLLVGLAALLLALFLRLTTAPVDDGPDPDGDPDDIG
jgi:hypothetical protein